MTPYLSCIHTLASLWPHGLLAADVGFCVTPFPSCCRRWLLQRYRFICQPQINQIYPQRNKTPCPSCCRRWLLYDANDAMSFLLSTFCFSMTPCPSCRHCLLYDANDAMSFLRSTFAFLWRHVLLADIVFSMTPFSSCYRHWFLHDAMSSLL